MIEEDDDVGEFSAFHICKEKRLSIPKGLITKWPITTILNSSNNRKTRVLTSEVEMEAQTILDNLRTAQVRT
jgi:hypothetical protein